jgi:uncharacterized membrane protein
MSSYVEFFIASLLFTVSTLAFGFAYILAEDMPPTLKWFFLPTYIATIFCGYFAGKIPKKTSYGEEMYARIKAYNEYISTIKKKELEAKIKEEPNYFDELLPYAFVFGISKKLVNKYDFKVDATNRYRNYTDNITSSVYYVENTSSSSGSSGSSSGCGGGCSSCGGGCSSCGGGGSW